VAGKKWGKTGKKESGADLFSSNSSLKKKTERGEDWRETKAACIQEGNQPILKWSKEERIATKEVKKQTRPLLSQEWDKALEEGRGGSLVAAEL